MYREQLRIRIPCLDCEFELTTVLMASHRRHVDGTEPEIDWNRLPVSQTEHIPQLFDTRFPKGVSQCPCPFPGCP